MMTTDTKKSKTLLEVKDLCKHYPIRKGLFSRISGYVYAVDGISFTINEGETLGLVGESGCGKSTVGRTILKLIEPSRGEIIWRGERIDGLSRSQMRPYRQQIQAVFQDPYSSLNPRMRSADIVSEPLRNFESLSRAQGRERVSALFERVGLRPDQMLRFPHEFSGGMRQRVMIAIAIACNPKLLFADEPTTALDVTVQAQILQLLRELREDLKMSMVLVTHDLGVVAGNTDYVAVMYAGEVVEYAPTKKLFADMRMPYTEALLESIPKVDHKSGTRLAMIAGRLPDPTDRGSGCSFAPRCKYAQEKCHKEHPELKKDPDGHLYRCWFPIGEAK